MTEASDRGRSANLLGALALVMAERVRASTDHATGRPSTDTAALVLLTTVLGGRSQDALAEVLDLTQSGAVRLVDRLSRDGLVERRSGPDGRTLALVATRAGETAARRALAERQATLLSALAVLDVEELGQLTTLTEKLLGSVASGAVGAARICRLCDPGVCGHCPVTEAVRGGEPPPGTGP